MIIAVLASHIVIALSSIAYTTVLFFKPSKTRFYKAYGLVVLTLISGTYLVSIAHTNILHSCISGLIYLGVISVAMIPAHVRLTNKLNTK